MEHARKLLLVDPRVLEAHQEYKELEKSAVGKQQAEHSLNLKHLLHRNDIPDDLKAKKYRQILNKFLNIGDSPPPAPVVSRQARTPKRRQQQQQSVETVVTSGVKTRSQAPRFNVAQKLSALQGTRKKKKPKRQVGPPQVHWSSLHSNDVSSPFRAFPSWESFK